jgi:hypothetical protein
MMVVGVLGPMFCSAVTAEFAPDLWLEPLELAFFGTLGACGNQPSAGTRSTYDAVHETVIYGACSLIA